MTSLFVLVPIGFALLAVAAWAFVWAVEHDQFEDLGRPGHDILFDDDLAPAPKPSDSLEPPARSSIDRSEPA